MCQPRGPRYSPDRSHDQNSAASAMSMESFSSATPLYFTATTIHHYHALCNNTYNGDMFACDSRGRVSGRRKYPRSRQNCDSLRLEVTCVRSYPVASQSEYLSSFKAPYSLLNSIFTPLPCASACSPNTSSRWSSSPAVLLVARMRTRVRNGFIPMIPEHVFCRCCVGAEFMARATISAAESQEPLEMPVLPR